MADGARAADDPLGEITLTYLRGLPDGSLTQAEVNLLVDYIEKLEAKLVGGRNEIDFALPYVADHEAADRLKAVRDDL